MFIDGNEIAKATNWTYGDVLKEKMATYMSHFLFITAGVFVTSTLAVTLWTMAGDRQTVQIRKRFFRAIMRQDIGWFDTHEATELNSRFSATFREGGHRRAVDDLVACLIHRRLYPGLEAHSRCHRLRAFVIIASALMMKLVDMASIRELQAYAKSGAIAEQALRAIRTVQAFQGQEKEHKRYEDNLVYAVKAGSRKGVYLGIAIASYWMLMFFSSAVCFWYGIHLNTDGGTILLLQVFLATFAGAACLGTALTNLESISSARAAATKIFEVIDRWPQIDVSSDKGEKIENLQGLVEFKNVHFLYPARPDIPVLNGLDLRVDPGQTVALVTVDGHDIKTLNLKWLRDQISVVSQEPVLFAATIAENIRYGKRDVTQAAIEAAAKEANAHGFISQLPQGYDTLVGERGAQLSRGQKQRIAIARALVRNPRILLLDEATSALDHESEAAVQSALEKVRWAGRTTIVIAHRLSTIRNADKIVSISAGCKEEEGNHHSLIAKGGLYAQLINLQVRHTYHSQQSDCIHPRNAQTKRRLTSNTYQEEYPSCLKRILQLNAPEWFLMLVGFICCSASGLGPPAFGFLSTEFIRIFACTDKEEQSYQAMVLGMIVIGIGLAMGFLNLLQHYCMSLWGSKLTARLRSRTFKALMRQDMNFFDDPKNQVSVLTTKLWADAATVQMAAGSKLGQVVEAVFTVAATLVIAFVFGWKLTLVTLVFIPVMIIADIAQRQLQKGMANLEKSMVQDAGKLCSEAVDNIRTLTSLNRADVFIERLELILSASNSLPLAEDDEGSSHSRRVLRHLQQHRLRLYAAAFTYGTMLVANEEMKFFAVFRVVITIVLGISSAGYQSSYGLYYVRAKLAAGRLFAIIDSQPKIDINKSGGLTLTNCSGQVAVADVTFFYPTRPTVRVLGGLTMSLEAGHTLALVGKSGCGKSTIIQLLLRFYEPDYGALVIIGRRGHRNLDLRWLRQQIGLVSQEPVLMDGSIASNIAYGDNTREVPMADIIAAAKTANIHSFIESLPQGYETNVGDKGTQLSGGQKQRIAIARALVRNPRVLLLDETTSALDTESQRVVQEALQKACEGRTCIVIAQRLSTIQNADMIAVIGQGQVVESGTHSQLLAMKGRVLQPAATEGRWRGRLITCQDVGQLLTYPPSRWPTGL
ncbi:hypothetical protein C0Q70_10295 [Pomacea canaliculata]|uniref:Bile salt export pump n=1 Tax=Pomacea canaliculata TaxID=400727 RepID=A0A2T7PC78_POMCA|nr:hypothetical protein C0Q70_10295 [Pomacea canaliculata]